MKATMLQEVAVMNKTRFLPSATRVQKMMKKKKQFFTIPREIDPLQYTQEHQSFFLQEPHGALAFPCLPSSPPAHPPPRVLALCRR